MSLSAEKPYTQDNKQFWERLYQAGTTPWDLGSAAPPLATFLKSRYAVKPGSVLVLGCGSGHDCMLFARHGFQVTGVDFAPSAVHAAAEKFVKAKIAGTRGFLLERDLFAIHEYDHYFDYVFEHSCFNAIHPSRRRTYAWTVHDLLKPGGKLIGLWWLLNHQGGPPFAVHRQDLYDLFSKHFTFDIVHVPNDSHPMRKGSELFTLMTAKT